MMKKAKFAIFFRIFLDWKQRIAVPKHASFEYRYSALYARVCTGIMGWLATKLSWYFHYRCSIVRNFWRDKRILRSSWLVNYFAIDARERYRAAWLILSEINAYCMIRIYFILIKKIIHTDVRLSTFKSSLDLIWLCGFCLIEWLTAT